MMFALVALVHTLLQIKAGYNQKQSAGKTVWTWPTGVENATTETFNQSYFANKSYPGRFKQNVYPNLTVVVRFSHNPTAAPYDISCAAGLTCLFSDKSWHEMSWNNGIVSFPESKKHPNTVFASLESPGHPGHLYIQKKKVAGLATVDLSSDIPLAYISSLRYIYKPKSEEIKIYRIAHFASNCDNVQSNRNSVVEVLQKRGLVDSFGSCQHNKDWNSTHKFPPAHMKEIIIRQYAFATAFENSYFPGYITEKLWVPLAAGILPLYLGAPNAKALLPKNSFIDVNRFSNSNELADFIEYLIMNKKDYEHYHIWRTMDISAELEETWRFLDQEPNGGTKDERDNCRLCRWGAENLYSV